MTLKRRCLLKKTMTLKKLRFFNVIVFLIGKSKGNLTLQL